MRKISSFFNNFVRTYALLLRKINVRPGNYPHRSPIYEHVLFQHANSLGIPASFHERDLCRWGHVESCCIIHAYTMHTHNPRCLKTRIWMAGEVCILAEHQQMGTKYYPLNTARTFINVGWTTSVNTFVAFHMNEKWMPINLLKSWCLTFYCPSNSDFGKIVKTELLYRYGLKGKVGAHFMISKMILSKCQLF